MPDLDQQLREYGTFLDDLDAEPRVVVGTVANRSRLVAAAVAVALVSGGVAIAARHDGTSRVSTAGSGGGEPTTTIAAPSTTIGPVVSGPGVLGARPTFAQQVARLEDWYAHSVAEAPNGRPILEAEAVFCADPSVGPNVNIRFASKFPLAEDLTEARIIDACRSDDPRTPSGSTPGVQLADQLCSTQRRGPDYDPSATVTEPVIRPAVVSGNGSCAAAGFDPFPDTLLAELNARRRMEIEIRAVPRDCPTQLEATAWASRAAHDQTGQRWTVIAPETAGTGGGSSVTTTLPPIPLAGDGSGTTTITTFNCYRPELIDWDLRRIMLSTFPPVLRSPQP